LPVESTTAQNLPPLHSGHSHGRTVVVLIAGVRLVPIDFTEAEQIMFTNIEIAADRRFLEFNVGDWSMLLGGFMLAGLLVWLI
jgi:hypothetical protein